MTVRFILEPVKPPYDLPNLVFSKIGSLIFKMGVGKDVKIDGLKLFKIQIETCTTKREV